MTYAGSASLSAATFESMVRELATALASHGSRVLVVDTGISTNAPVARALAGLERTLHLRVNAGPRARAAWARATQPHGGHADEIETSIIMALAPDAVAMERAEASPVMPPGPGPMQHADPGAGNYSRSGSIGDPTRASRATGEAMLEAMVEAMVEDMTETMRSWL